MPPEKTMQVRHRRTDRPVAGRLQKSTYLVEFLPSSMEAETFTY
jgi:hypothetical protein